MNRNTRYLLTAAMVLPALFTMPCVPAQEPDSQAETKQTSSEKETISKIRQLMEDGNFKESAEAARAALEAIPANSQSEAIGDLCTQARSPSFSSPSPYRRNGVKSR